MSRKPSGVAKARQKRLTLDTDYRPHEGQRMVHASRKRFRVLVCGRQWGKSLVAKTELSGTHPTAWRGALQVPRGLFWLVTRTFALAKREYRDCVSALSPVIKVNSRGKPECSDSELRIVLLNDAVLEFKTADQPDLLRGRTLSGLVLDEVTLSPGRLWHEILAPATSVRKAWVLFTGTARGQRSWVYPLFLRGKDEAFPDWESWQRPCTDNPLIGEEELDVWRQSLPEAFFRQEYLAEFLDDAVGFFQRVEDAYDGQPPSLRPSSGMFYVMGVDLARAEDFTVCVVLEIPLFSSGGRMRVAAFERWRRVDWSTTKSRIVALSEMWGRARMVVDATGGSVGDPIVEDLARAIGPRRVEGFKFTAASKDELLRGLAVALESGRLSLPGRSDSPAFPQLDTELRGYGWTFTGASGTPRPGPRDGGADDSVMALALAVKAASVRAVGVVDLGSFGVPRGQASLFGDLPVCFGE